MMPVVFIGHGSPMNIIEDNQFSSGWRQIAASIPKPKAILVISAHWFTTGSYLLTTPYPTTIYDFYGFPDELYRIEYPAPGAPDLAHRVGKLIGSHGMDSSRGLDHGAWSVLKMMYPNADVPVTQLSVNQSCDTRAIFSLGEKLRPLREEGVLILSSGNVVHNLSLIDFSTQGGFQWADEFDLYIQQSLQDKAYERVIDYTKAGESAKYAFFTPDHFYPLVYALGAASPDDNLQIYNDSRIYGSLSMTSYVFG